MELRIEYLPVEALTPYKKNARKHHAEDVSAIVNSIREFGFNDPIGVWGKDNIIVEGHGRLLAAKQLKMKTVPVIRLDQLTDEQRRAYALVHNKTAELSSWDFDMLESELADLDIDMDQFGFDLEEEKEDKPLDEVTEDDFDPYDVPEARSKPGDVFILGKHRLMCGDSTSTEDLEILMDGAEADLLVTDPPNVDYHGSTPNAMTIQNDNMEDQAFVAFLINAFTNADIAMKPGAAFYIWHADSNGFQFRQAVHDINWKLRQTLIWVKNALVLGRQDYQWKHEPCLYGWKSGSHYFTDDRSQPTVIDDKIDIRKLKKDEMLSLLEEIFSDKVPTTVIYEDKPLVNDIHPTMKPIKLLARLIRNSSRPEQNVLDIFGGSGSTLMACEQLDRRCFMMELDPRYCDAILKRWEDYTGRKAELANGRL